MTGLQTRRRVLHAWFPFLPTDRIVRVKEKEASGNSSSRPLVTVECRNGAQTIAAANDHAVRSGLQPGLTLAQARAQSPDLAVEDADAAAESATLERLARAAGRYTPFVGLDPPSGLFLDVTGCAHLFGGEATLLDDVMARFGGWGFSTRAAIADEPGVAWGMAHYSHGGVVPIGHGMEALAPLDIAALRLPAETTATLHRLGLKSVRLLLDQPRKSIVRRFGTQTARRIDQAAGVESEPISPLAPLASLVFERHFAEPVIQSEALVGALGTLAQRLCTTLCERGEGVRRLNAALFRTDGRVYEIHAGSSEPLNDQERIVHLLEPKLDNVSVRIEGDGGIDLVRLAALETESKLERQASIDGSEQLRADLARLVDTLSSRFGAHAVHRLAPRDSNHPASADRSIAARNALEPPHWPVNGAVAADTHNHDPGAAPIRPIRLIDPPERVEALAVVPDGPPLRFVWRRVTRHVAAAEGPERIAPSWWESPGDNALTCDYFRVEDSSGQRLWMFRRGLYGQESRDPQWFVHGVFA